MSILTWWPDVERTRCRTSLVETSDRRQRHAEIEMRCVAVRRQSHRLAKSQCDVKFDTLCAHSRRSPTADVWDTTGLFFNTRDLHGRPHSDDSAKIPYRSSSDQRRRSLSDVYWLWRIIHGRTTSTRNASHATSSQSSHDPLCRILIWRMRLRDPRYVFGAREPLLMSMDGP